jgi:ferredoxin
MQEFIYYSQDSLEFPLAENICVTTQKEAHSNAGFIVSNSSDVHAEVIAKEINFYIKNSEDALSDKIKNVEKLYEINAVRYDFAKDIEFTQEITNQVLLVGTSEEKELFLESIHANEFDLYHVSSDIVKTISGHIGNLTVVVDDEGNDVELNVSLIVWFNATPMAFRQSGSFDPMQSSIQDVLETLRKNINHYSYKKFTTYDSTICQYHERREEICGKCEEVCPTVAIVKDDATKHLTFSQIDCHGCGGCVSVCPSGAIDYTPTNRESLYEISKFYEGHIALVIPEKMDMEHLNVSLKPNVLPFSIEGEKFLHEQSLLTLLQESGSQVVFYTDFLSKGTKDSILILNQIYQNKYGMDAVLLAMNEEELKEALINAQRVENSRFTFNHTNSRKREIFSIRLQHIVGNDDLGEITTGEHIHYAQVKVNEKNCTLCLSCVGACNVSALTANPKDNTLRLNASLCTACGYCELSCPEKECLSIQKDVIKLNPVWFSDQILAQDELFACVECGKEFATKKAVEKIAAIMSPIFSKDPVKERTLYCCEVCKPKIMMQEYVHNQHNYNKKNQGM